MLDLATHAGNTILGALTSNLLSWGATSACVGSFLTVVGYRVPLIWSQKRQGLKPTMSLAWPPSTCGSCGTQIKAWHNVPILGFLALKGKTHCCSQKMPLFYLKVELLATIWGLSAMLIASRHPVLTLLLSIAGWLGMAAVLVTRKETCAIYKEKDST